ncbi:MULTISPECIES: acyltransferase family protein [unclassified Beijerinckia]|uniref:acyltransferase family protein n=1 Tax=unclassified Beijerinckia TaxID=2638183 RepID=UPI0008953703|nr:MULTISPECIES: acyltransferase family protein [unclassified Beijerinckia]MDH7797905.1 peptidoglycan/LPS O-acetylase OafA/YrhL/lysophospholipase L1-like esterase [Beijerinckia sp. GAS462]SED02417.1 Peptidoglycan/LPS O-acetylase OafA/YrhL, contains acyltransferase and SGNH-hydrolase domains [Beijerinckia sp. 28-YEA-48]
MHRLASLDLLRGVAALAVAIPHYVMLGSTDWPVANVISILAVEIFFVLSGFVLAPQLIHCATSSHLADTWIFLIRRWMRTIPPYLVALITLTVVSGNLGAASFPQYLFYIQNLFRPLSDAQDYFAVAWSLSVEECFYVVAAVIVVAANVARLRARGFITLMVLLAVASAVARSVFGDFSHWDADVRRVTLFRLDAIAFGFLLYCAIDPIDKALRRFGGVLSIVIALAAAALAGVIGWQATVDTNRIAQELYPFAAALLGASVIVTLYVYRAAFNRLAWIAEPCFFLGKVSYTIYLFHTLAILLLRPSVAHLPLTVQLVLYVVVLVAFCAIFFFAFEGPILAARPHYLGRGRAAVAMVAKARRPATPWLALLLTLVGFVIAAIATRYFFFEAWRVSFYLALLVFLGLFTALLMLSGLWRFGLARTGALTLLLFAVLLPMADAYFARTSVGAVLTRAEPVYSFRDAKGDPDAFRMWWAQYVAEWGRGVLAKIQAPDPKGELPFILEPNARGQFFDADVPINNLGFRGADMTADKGNRYRIFVVGESPVFGTMFRRGETTWPEVLQKQLSTRLVCERPIEVINAGVPAAGLSDNLQRVKRFILPLHPDMVISYHGYNGLAIVDPQIAAMPRQPVFHMRGSPLLGEASFRIAMQGYQARLEDYNRTPKQTQFLDTYDKLYSELVKMGVDNGFRVVLANLSAVVNESSPHEVIDFYGRVFQPIERILPAIAAHNRMVEAVAKRTGTPFVDTRPHLDGEWDKDLFVDIVHFTQKGSDIIATTMFDKLASELGRDPTMNCKPVN